MLLVDDLAAGGTKNLRHTPRGLVTLLYMGYIKTASRPARFFHVDRQKDEDFGGWL